MEDRYLDRRGGASGGRDAAFIEFLPSELSESSLRKDLLTKELHMIDGRIPLPARPGLGVELNREALGRFKEAARRVKE